MFGIKLAFHENMCVPQADLINPTLRNITEVMKLNSHQMY